MPQLVAGIDPSRESTRAARFATRLAAQLDAELILTEIVPLSALPAGHGPHPIFHDAALKLAHSRLESEVEQAGASEAGTRVELGDPAERLVAFSEDDETLLLIVGSRGRGAAKAAALGSVSRRLIADAACPVIVVPPAASAESVGDSSDDLTRRSPRMLEKIVCGYDGSEEGTLAVLAAGSVARPLGARLVVTRIAVPVMTYVPSAGVAPPLPDQHRELQDRERPGNSRLHDVLSQIPSGVEVETYEADGYPADQLRELAEAAGADLISVGSSGRGALATLLLGSTSASLTADSPCPVMVCTRRARMPDADRRPRP